MVGCARAHCQGDANLLHVSEESRILQCVSEGAMLTRTFIAWIVTRFPFLFAFRTSARVDMTRVCRVPQLIERERERDVLESIGEHWRALASIGGFADRRMILGPTVRGAELCCSVHSSARVARLARLDPVPVPRPPPPGGHIHYPYCT